MMRCDQHMGLPADAVIFLQENEVPEKVCEHCNRPYPRKLEVINHYVGMFEDHFPLYRHQLVDGRFANEYIQSDAWSSGPCFFLGLDIRDGNTTVQKFEWANLLLTTLNKENLMIGIFKVDKTNISHFDWWIGEWLLLFGSLIGILSFSYLVADWNVRWINYRINNKENLMIRTYFILAAVFALTILSISVIWY